MTQVNDPDRRPAQDYAPPADTNEKEAQQLRRDQNREANAAREEHDREVLASHAVDENDPRVVPHLGAVSQTATYDAEAQKRHEEALLNAKTVLDEDNAKIDAARQNVANAQDALDKAYAERDTHLAEYNRLDQAILTPPVAHQLAPGEETELMFFPRPIMLNANGKTVQFPTGVHHVPHSLSAHRWLIDNGARPYKGAVPAPEAEHTEPDPEADPEIEPPIRTRPVNEPERARA